MGVLLLNLSGPLQSWGDGSRYTQRLTRHEPTKSGVVGLLASALGRSREEDVSDLVSLEFAVRTDQAGTLVRDYQTAKPRKGNALPVSNRFYLADARFLAALSGPDELLLGLDDALRAPVWPLFLGRRSCPADPPVSLGVADGCADVREALAAHPWLASDWYRERAARTGVTTLEVTADARSGERGEGQNDLPLSFSREGRKYAKRAVVRYRVPIPDGSETKAGRSGTAADVPEHDPMGF